MGAVSCNRKLLVKKVLSLLEFHQMIADILKENIEN